MGYAAIVQEHGSGAFRPRPRLWRRQHDISVGEMLVVVRSHRLAHFMAQREVSFSGCLNEHHAEKSVRGPSSVKTRWIGQGVLGF